MNIHRIDVYSTGFSTEGGDGDQTRRRDTGSRQGDKNRAQPKTTGQHNSRRNKKGFNKGETSWERLVPGGVQEEEQSKRGQKPQQPVTCLCLVVRLPLIYPARLSNLLYYIFNSFLLSPHPAPLFSLRDNPCLPSTTLNPSWLEHKISDILQPRSSSNPAISKRDNQYHPRSTSVYPCLKCRDQSRLIRRFKITGLTVMR